jgi:hypothetical protein
MINLKLQTVKEQNKISGIRRPLKSDPDSTLQIMFRILLHRFH